MARARFIRPEFFTDEKVADEDACRGRNDY